MTKIRKKYTFSPQIIIKAKESRNRKCRWYVSLTFVLSLFFIPTSTLGYDVTEEFSVGGVLAGTYQYLSVNDAPDTSDGGKPAVSVQPEMSFRLTEVDAFFIKFGFAAGNGLNTKSPFALTVWDADLEDDVKDINGRNRDYLLTAWYKHTFQFREALALELSGGLVDSTVYLDENDFANDQYNQFLNAAFVNAPTGFFPTYDIGGALQLLYGKFSVNGVYMDVGKNDDDNNYQFCGIQLAQALESSLGKGNYRVTVDATSEDFLDTEGEHKDRLAAVTLSFDQQFGDIVGAFIRIGLQDDKAAVEWEKLYSGGINVSGGLWGRQQDNIGIGVAYLDGGNQDLDDSLVAEAYVRFVLNQFLATTLDCQYLKDDVNGSKNPEGIIAGIRLTAEF
jgi:hypothetical protein